MFIRFLIDIKANVQCIVCGRTGWNVRASHVMDTDVKVDDLVVSHLPFAHLNESDNTTKTFMGGTPVLIASCKTCGYMRLHDYGTVHASLNEETTEGESVESPEQ